MNPQADNDADALKRRLTQSPPVRNASPLNVPPRTGSVHDFDDSAFTPEDEPQPQINRPTPVVPQQPVPVSPVILPAAPAAPPHTAPAHEPAPQATVPAADESPKPTPPAKPVPPATPPPAPTPPVPEQPSGIPLPAPAEAMPPNSPPSVPEPVAPPPIPPEPPKLPPLQVATVEHGPSTATPAFDPGPAPAHIPPSPPVQQATAASYQPSASASSSSSPHIEKALIERIDETPQQNSKDIEGLIEHNHRLHRLKSLASFLLFVAGVVIAAFLINQFIFQSYYVDGTSMTPTLQNDDRLIIDKVERTIANLQGKPYVPERGQVVVLDSSIVGFNGREEQLIKRVIGLPGDTVIIKDGVVTIKNKLNPDGFNVDRQLALNVQPTFVESPQEWVIGEGHLFVMGDNRVENGSYDSRAFGPIESGKIVGRLWARILPFEKAQVF